MRIFHRCVFLSSQNFVVVKYLLSGVPKSKRGIVGVLQPHPLPPLLRTMSNLRKVVEKYFQTLSRSTEPHVPSSICRFSPYGFSMFLQYERTLSSEQKHKLNPMKHNNHKNARTNESFEALLRRFPKITFIYILY